MNPENEKWGDEELPFLGHEWLDDSICHRSTPGGVCGKPAVVHIIWNGLAASSCCVEHKPLLAEREYRQVHDFQIGCSQPSALWFEDDFECRVPVTDDDFDRGIFLAD